MHTISACAPPALTAPPAAAASGNGAPRALDDSASSVTRVPCQVPRATHVTPGEGAEQEAEASR